MKRGKCVFSCGNDMGIFEKMLNEFFYSESWRVSEDGSGVHALNIANGKEYPDDTATIVHKKGRYGFYRLVR